MLPLPLVGLSMCVFCVHAALEGLVEDEVQLTDRTTLGTSDQSDTEAPELLAPTALDDNDEDNNDHSQSDEDSAEHSDENSDDN